MTKFVCIGCGFEGDEKKLKDGVCPYCGEDLEEKKDARDTGYIDDKAKV